ncbi:alpha-1,4-glucan:alpha-1,4-glucan 6-glycosyltransferase [Propioniferax innocua]|uniref:1,4-alpha-glucan branching enzyme GlgB n=1 Tax=Propioniferax innocua TaxID=1753 RepID=A0A542ZQ59_9ACTN|nr:alpha-1,4-glucan:alpha-1,4-glucan 6-glycosyltransferase [Propioniferax innocua]
MTEPYPTPGLQDVAQVVWQHVSTARWFADKGRGCHLARIVPLPWLHRSDDLAVRPELVEVRFDDGSEPHWYQALLAYARPETADAEGNLGRVDTAAAPGALTEGAPTPDHYVLADATRVPAAMTAVLDSFTDQTLSDNGPARLECHLVDDGYLHDRSGREADLSPVLFTGEQSNTSIMYGRTAMLKVFRRLEAGENLDIEVHRALVADAGAPVARLHGSVRVQIADGPEMDLAMLAEQLREPVNGWELAVSAASSNTDFSDHARGLGQALAQVHGALARAFDTSAVDGGTVAASMRTRLESVAGQVSELTPHREGLAGTFAALEGRPLPVQRVHGDFHLGQVLLSEDTWRIIDFEGEPLKSFAERRQLDAVWRDIAGMLRSFDYAGATATRSGADPDAASAWVDSCTDAFLDGYGAMVTPELRAYMADKAIYEVLYEARNRPGWLPIPMAAAAGLAAGSTKHMSSRTAPTATRVEPTDPTHEGGAMNEPIDPEPKRAIDAPSVDPRTWFGGLTGRDFEGFHTGGDTELWKRLGAHAVTVTDTDGRERSGVRFTVWAPNAREVRVFGDFNDWNGESHPMELIPGTGVWGIFVEDAHPGQVYKFKVHGADGRWVDKADPMARFAQSAPETGSIVTESHYEWNDADWLERRGRARHHAEPISIYEIHLGGWRRGKTYVELADELVEYVSWQGYTHVEFLPLAQHPYEPSWGYQVTGYFAPMSMFGTPDEFRYLIDRLHQAGIGVIMDWVPGHFPKDEWALGRFDGTALYEHADPRQGEQPDWGTYVFNFGRNEVKSFLVSNALYWIKEFHIDGLRVDAVASMLYLDYSREDGAWVPNMFGGRENLEAVDFLRYVNTHLYEREPGIMMIAEESTSWPGVTRPVDQGGLGFGFKWNMGWMNDTLSYIQREPVHRQYHHNDMTFAMVYSFSENFVLPISHDEVVHGKGSMINKVPEDDWRKFATLRAYYSFMWSHPGKQLVFMGCEFGQRSEFDESKGLEWWVSDLWGHRGLQLMMRRLNELYRQNSPLFELDNDAAGFRWINADDAGGNVFSYLRFDSQGSPMACLVNFSPVPRPVYRIGLPHDGPWRELFNSDAMDFHGTGEWHNNGWVQATDVPAYGLPASADVVVPPLGAVWLVPVRE